MFDPSAVIEFLASPRPFLAVVAGVVRGGLVGDQTRGQLVLFCPNFVCGFLVSRGPTMHRQRLFSFRDNNPNALLTRCCQRNDC